MNNYPDHRDNLNSLRRIEGQVRGICRMIEEGKYCVDILNQLHAAIRALASVEDKVLERHFAGCVKKAVSGKSAAQKQRKLKEILRLIHQFRKL